MKTINISAMMEAGVSIEDFFEAGEEEREILFTLFPGPEVTITYVESDEDKLILPS